MEARVLILLGEPVGASGFLAPRSLSEPSTLVTAMASKPLGGICPGLSLSKLPVYAIAGQHCLNATKKDGATMYGNTFCGIRVPFEDPSSWPCAAATSEGWGVTGGCCALKALSYCWVGWTAASLEFLLGTAADPSSDRTSQHVHTSFHSHHRQGMEVRASSHFQKPSFLLTAMDSGRPQSGKSESSPQSGKTLSNKTKDAQSPML